MTVREPRRLILAALILGAAGAVLATDRPDSALNPQNGDIYIADPVKSGSNQDIDFVVDSEDETRSGSEPLADHALDDRLPGLVVAASGDAWVTWTRDDATDRVLVRKRHFADGSWDAERVLSEPDENSYNAKIAHDGSAAWVAYEVDGPGETDIAVSIVIDEPDPVGVRAIVAGTHRVGARDVTIKAYESHLWVTWIDSSTEVGWVEYDYATETWSAPAYESYMMDSVAQARSRIRTTVMND